MMCHITWNKQKSVLNWNCSTVIYSEYHPYVMSELTSVPTSSLSSTSVTTSVQEVTTNGSINYLFISGHSIHWGGRISYCTSLQVGKTCENVIEIFLTLENKYVLKWWSWWNDDRSCRRWPSLADSTAVLDCVWISGWSHLDPCHHPWHICLLLQT